METEIDWAKMAICPFDATHVVASLRLSTHVNKCRKHHPEKHVRMCPFNATHYIENHMYQHHLLHCSDRAVIDRDIMQSAELDEANYSGNIALPSYDNRVESEENWDDEDNYPCFDLCRGSTYSSSTQVVRQPRQEPAVLDSMDQAEIHRRLEERRQSRQVNASNSFLGRSGDAGGYGAGTSTHHVNGAAHGGRARDGNGASGGNSDSDGAGVVSPGGASGAGVSGGNGVCRENGRFAGPILAGFGRGMAAQESIPTSSAPVGRGQAALRTAQALQQPRKVTQTAAFTLPGVGRGFGVSGRGASAAPGGTRPGQGGR